MGDFFPDSLCQFETSSKIYDGKSFCFSQHRVGLFSFLFFPKKGRLLDGFENVPESLFYGWLRVISCLIHSDHEWFYNRKC